MRDDEFERQLRDYAVLTPQQQAQLRAEAARRAQAERHRAIAAFFGRLAFWRRARPAAAPPALGQLLPRR